MPLSAGTGLAQWSVLGSQGARQVLLPAQCHCLQIVVLYLRLFCLSWGRGLQGSLLVFISNQPTHGPT